MNRPTHFEIPAENPARAMDFYGKVLGWTFTAWPGPEPYWLVTTGPKDQPGIDGGLMMRRDPAQPCVNTTEVADLELTLRTVGDAGGTVVVPRFAIPTVGWLAYCKDTEGHIFGVMQTDPAAA